MMEVTITLTDEQAKVLRTWSSVGRHLDNTKSVLNKLDNLVNDDNLNQDVIYLLDDIDLLKPALTSVCYQIREQLVKTNTKTLWNPLGDN